MGPSASDVSLVSLNCEMKDLVKRTFIFDRLGTLVRVLLVAWLLAYYILPATAFGRWSPGRLLMIVATHFTFIPQSVVVGGWVCLTIVLLARITSRNQVLVLPLWIPTAVILTRLYTGVWSEGQGPDGPFGVLSVLCATTTGISVACVARTIKAAILGFAVVSLVQAGYALVNVHNGANVLLSGELPRAIGTFEDPGNLYVLMLVAIPLCLAMAFDMRIPAIQMLLTTTTAATLATLVLTWYRGGALAVGICLSWMVWRLTGSARIFVVVALAAVVFVSFTFLRRSEGSINAASAVRSSAGHSKIFRQGSEIFIHHPLAGVGVGNVEINVKTATNLPNIFQGHMLATPKNLILFYLCEQGILGVIPLLLLSWVVIKRLQAGAKTFASIGIASAWLALLTAGITDTPFGPADAYVGNCLFGFLIGLTAMVHQDDIKMRIQPRGD